MNNDLSPHEMGQAILAEEEMQEIQNELDWKEHGPEPEEEFEPEPEPEPEFDPDEVD